MHPITVRLRLALITLAFVCAFALSGIVQTGGVPRDLASGVSTGVVHGWSILRVGGKMHLDDVSLGFVSRKAGKGPLDY